MNTRQVYKQTINGWNVILTWYNQPILTVFGARAQSNRLNTVESVEDITKYPFKFHYEL